jgi:hypothetical protein
MIWYGRVNLDIVWHVLIKEGGCNMQYPVDKYDIFWHALIVTDNTLATKQITEISS